MHAVDSVSIGVVLDDEVSDSTGDCKRGLGDGSDDVEFVGMFVDDVDGMGEPAWGCLGELVDVEAKDSTRGSGRSGCGRWGVWCCHLACKAVHAGSAE
jgi:hypothetical protein